MNKRSDLLLTVIAIFKLVKMVLLLLVAAAAFRLLRTGDVQFLEDWIERIPVFYHSVLLVDFLHKLEDKVVQLSDRTVWRAGMIALVYSALLATEGVGLLMRKRWAEYLTIVITASLVPFELYELTHKVTVARVVVTLINVVIVAYLIWRVRGEAAGAQSAPAAAPATD